MAEVRTRAEHTLDAPPGQAMAFLRDYRNARPRLLTDAFSEYRVEQGGEGAGTVFAYHFHAGRRERDYRMHVEESERELRERDEHSSFVMTWTVEPAGAEGCRVTIESRWNGASGLAGFFERTFAPMGLRRIYEQMLGRLGRELGATAG